MISNKTRGELTRGEKLDNVNPSEMSRDISLVQNQMLA